MSALSPGLGPYPALISVVTIRWVFRQFMGPNFGFVYLLTSFKVCISILSLGMPNLMLTVHHHTWNQHQTLGIMPLRYGRHVM